MRKSRLMAFYIICRLMPEPTVTKWQCHRKTERERWRKSYRWRWRFRARHRPGQEP